MPSVTLPARTPAANRETSCSTVASDVTGPPPPAGAPASRCPRRSSAARGRTRTRRCLPARRLLGRTRRPGLVTQESLPVVEVAGPAGAYEGYVPGSHLDAGLLRRGPKIVLGDTVPPGEGVQPVQTRDVEEHAAADHGLHRVYAVLLEPAPALGFLGGNTAVELAFVGDVGEGVHVGTGVAAGHKHLVCGRAPVFAHHVPVTAHQRHAKGRMVGRVGRLGREWLRQVVDLNPVLQGFQQPAHDTPSRSRRASARVRRAEPTTASSTNLPSSRAKAPVPVPVDSSNRARRSFASATSSSVGVKTSFITSICAGWIAERPTKPVFLPSIVERRRPSASRTLVYTLCTGPGHPAALVAATSRERA